MVTSRFSSSYPLHQKDWQDFSRIFPLAVWHSCFIAKKKKKKKKKREEECRRKNIFTCNPHANMSKCVVRHKNHSFINHNSSVRRGCELWQGRKNERQYLFQMRKRQRFKDLSVIRWIHNTLVIYETLGRAGDLSDLFSLQLLSNWRLFLTCYFIIYLQ